MDEQQRISDVGSSSNSPSKKYDVSLSFRGEDTPLSFRGEDPRMNFTSLLFDALTRAEIEKGDEISPALVIMDKKQRIGAIASSSNSSSPISSKEYDVFLSFRGEDTRQNFTSLLYDALTKKNIKTFIDDLLVKGDEISPALIKAIEDSHISVVIFSKKYASSKWCLNELSKIMGLQKEKRQIVIPVFYKVDPSHVRHQTGSYKKAFAKHEGQPMCRKWKAALTEAANLSGWHSQNRTEAELLKDIVQDVLQKLAHTYPNQLEKLVGIGESYEEIESLLKIGSNEVITLGIWGMGGIGKTTLATALYDNLSYQFEGHCFLANVMEKSSNLKALSDELFSKLLGEKNHEIDNFDIRRLQSKKVFIVLDDVSTQEQLEKLTAKYHAGSRVIVTTRNRQILSKRSKIYEVVKLNPGPSLELFCLTAFEEKQPKQGYEDLSRRVISYCKGVPLALKVVGASLHKRSKEEWECELRKLQEIPNMDIHKVLKLSYDGLDHSQKDIFLDIACFFKGEERDRVKGILEASGFYATSGIATLLDKALITISHANKIEMHDLIQEMGREIVHQESKKFPGKRSRLWKHEDVLDVLKDNKGTDDVEGIILNLVELKGDLYLSSDFLAKMTNVRFLKIHKEYRRSWGDEFNLYLHDGLESLSDKLSYLHWDSCSLESRLPKFCAEQLVELRMQDSNLEKLWDGVQNLMNLKSIDLSFSTKLVEIPDLSKAEKLERVSLAYCYSLHQLHPSVLSLPKLTYLDLRYCKEIKSLQSNVHSKSLKEPRLRDCSSLKKFSVTSNEIKVLNLSNTAICALSPSIGDLLSLEVLDLSGTNVESLPENIKNLSMLTWLELKGCKKLVSLPELPPSLEALHLIDCWQLESLPELPSSLIKLSLDSCMKLESLPELPPSLRELPLNNCEKLVSLPELPSSLIKLYLEDCWTLVSLSKLPSSLMELYLNNCEKLVSLPELPPSLRELYLNNCRKLVSLPELPSFLLKLPLNDCRKLVSLPELPPSLVELYLNDCKELVSLPKLPSSLIELSLNNCMELEYLPELPPSLRELPLNNCRKLVSLPELPSSLLKLPLNDCCKLVSLPELPPSLVELYLNDCKELVSLPKLPSSLIELSLNNCMELEYLPELPPSLRELPLNNCRKLVSLPKLPNSLIELYLDDCWTLVSLPELPSSLMELYLNNCEKLVSLPELPPSLRELYLNNCRKLVSLPELPSSLLQLRLNDCRKLMSLPELPSSLRELPLNNCLKLVSLPKLPPSVKMVSTFNCISLNRDITQGLLLEHMSQSRIPYLHEQYLNKEKNNNILDDYFIFPGDHVTNESGFHTAVSSLTIPDLPKSDLLGFICCITFPNGRDLDVSDDAVWDGVLGERYWEDEEFREVGDFSVYGNVSIDIYQDGKEINLKQMEIECPENLISDHVFFSYVDISQFGRISEVCDQFGNITFKFKFEYDWDDLMIKGCGVFLVYATTSGLKLVGHDQENLLEYKSIAQIFDNKAQSRAIGVGGSNNENEDGWEQLPTSKRQKTSP